MRYGLDVGGTKIHAVALTADGSVIASVRRPTGFGAEAVVGSILATFAALRAESGVEATSVGVGIPGLIEPGSTLVRHAVNLGIENLELAPIFADHTGAPIRVENDVKAATLGAYLLHGSGDSMAYLNVGTGVAAGLMVAGELVSGSSGTAGEVGHISIDPAGELCHCGQRGCIEALCGGRAVTERWGRGGDFPIRDIYDAADARDEEAVRLRSAIATGVAGAVRVLVLTADVERVVVGGGVSAVGARLLADVRSRLHDESGSSPFLHSLGLGDRIELLPPSSPAAAIGAALVGVAKEPEGALGHG